MPVRDLRHVEELAREYRIIFAGELSRSKWPDRHRGTLEAIQRLSNKEFDDYTDGSDMDNEPWRVEVRSLASKLREQARRCSQRNESSWRFACEPVILGRISSEVCCQNCRKRLWRSEIEVAQDDDSQTATNLRRRQEAREPCRCPRIARGQDFLEVSGLNSIFHFRIDEEVHHDKEISEKLGNGEKPDRVYGLRQTRNIENLLHDAAKRHFQDTNSQVTKEVQELIELGQPLTQTGDRLLFPFLVLEAKSGNAGDSWHSIQMQTAFSIRTLLDTQDRLRKATGPFSKWKSGPLVWFLANKGEDWRVSLCYTEAATPQLHTIGTTEYERVIDVWRGSIISRNGPLQLLLLVDYILDWARDKYRNDIIAELRLLASGDNDTASALYVDSDIFSTLQVDPRNYFDDQSSQSDGVDTAVSLQKAFNYDSSSGVVRHAKFVDSRFCAILITKDNVQLLLRSTAPSHVRKLCNDIIYHVSKEFVVEASDIDDLELHWTGTRHPGWAYRHQRQSPYYTSLSFCTYLDAKWHIVYELTVIAVALDAWTDIVLASSLNESKKEALIQPSIPKITVHDTLFHAVRRLQAGSPAQILLSAINRLSVSLGIKKENGDVTIEPHLGHARDIFHFIYCSAKRGILEPQEPFMRFSKKLNQQDRLDIYDGQLFHADPHVSDEGCVLVTGTCVPPDEDRLRRNICVYLTTGDSQKPSNQNLSLIIKNAYETCDVYHTTRNHGLKPKPNLSWYNRDHVWNLKNTYGVHSQSFGFLRLLQKLGGKAPVTQGSPRASSESGRLQYKRNLAPWQDSRSAPTYCEQRRFVLYKIFSQEIAYWRSVAKNRQAEGESCCSCCAKVGSVDICRSCQKILDSPNYYTWMKRCLRGEAAFELLKPSAEEMESRLDYFQQCPGISARWMFRGPKKGLDDDDWASLLDFYPRLNEPFEDIQQLAIQWKDYETYCLNQKYISEFGSESGDSVSP